jgi:magnesium chelatase subunit I
MVFTANPEDYTARGKIITPLKDRIGSEIRTHYPASRAAAMDITEQEAWQERGGLPLQMPPYVREVVEEVAFQARSNSKVDKRSGVSQRLPISVLENVISNAERRALVQGETVVVPRVADVYAAIPAITGKFELEYEGELKGADAVARDLIRSAVLNVATGYFRDADARGAVRWFDGGGSLQLSDATGAKDLVDRTREIDGLHESALQANGGTAPGEAELASAVDFALEALCAQKKISRSDDWRYTAGENGGSRNKQGRERDRARQQEAFDDDEMNVPGKKKYYN